MAVKAIVWLHFIRMDQNNAKYSVCAKDVPEKDENTTNIIRKKKM